MAEVRHLGLTDIVRHFEGLEDPRSPVNRRHPLVSVVVIALRAVLAGADGPTAIARWALMKREFLLRVQDLPHGIPGKDAFRRVLLLLKPAAFQACFADWLWSLRLAACDREGVERPVLSVDGKTARRSHDRQKGLGPLHAVTVWASELGLALGQVACAEQSNEITALPEVLRLVDIQGTIFTIDTLGTQKGIAKQVIDGGADYVLALKGNQGTLHRAVMEYLTEQLDTDFAGVTVRRYQTRETGHGRQETRRYSQLPAPKGLPGLGQWAGLKSIGLVVSECVRDGQGTLEVRYYISSLGVGVRRFAHAVRSHWGIENGLHWVLDVIFGEDESRLRDRRAAENLGQVRRVAVSLLRQDESKGSIRGKLHRAAWDDEFRLRILHILSPESA